ncbi:HAD-IA family hydrolase [Microlunatus flavus]|uniref:Sugar-phosphatase n=1 Tax=Microlunatus flavus TaxID=1036181 RepID=A0A1H9AYS9_9ACTN|nr:HAD-IA family hydrolase [Microlunatus flavus]SEP81884.1 sugar-phosphatase [Microlunatus flavus]
MGLNGLEDRVFDAVLFDMDGTLVDSTAAVYRAWARWAVEHGLSEDQMRGHDGIPAASIVAKFLPEAEREAGVLRINELELNDTEGLLVLPGATEALAAVADAPNAIATSCTMPLAKARIASSGLVAPKVLVTADQVEHGKPAPDPYLLAAERLGVDPTRCLVVEDAPLGLQAAKAAGCATLAVVTTTAREKLQADAVVSDLSEVRFEAGPEGIRVRSA